MKLTIITINYNNCEGLRKTIESVVNQTWKEFEWIIIDGGSTDGSRELIEETVKSCSNISFWCSEPDKGVYNAMNKGIAYAHGKYMNFMNSGDTFYDELVLENVFKDRYEADVLYGDWTLLKKDGSKVCIIPPCSVDLLFFIKSNICHQAMFIKSSILKDAGYDEKFYTLADQARWIKLSSDGGLFQYIPCMICIYEDGGISTQNNNVKEEIRMAHLSVCDNLKGLVLQYAQEHEKLMRYEECYLTKQTLELVENNSLFAKAVHINLVFLQAVRKIINIFL